ncbi:hypothetical protein [Reyranella sp.]|jgi:hypothetical protein|uniref:hypothetical protein n=1 Tax=Reyranella sp. TaxID=1929291 RepID=UPI000BCFF1CD|nr:hypothetical protein [Reyranella sp.]OYY40443.1 MAG: hypothetical protein B7Y57_17185 [Rhodospirillales bacterium 35-66-84]OYZ93059.1 MAG: hypothetical protein B7Y08_18430 [Rhodospirillales bacterium 24-66-33]OZB24188.1 MAG: hypothetical protein B7X63_16395 [Rhodospirillales bacterium 39-66-50]HQS18782.1 hypothetical protein [Reyranella sp.]HQT14908.1 hypothetical protein [Reyranella sp.]
MHSPAPAPTQALPLLGARLRKLAESVRSIGYGQHQNPERILSAKQQIAAEMEKLAALVEGGPR